MIRPVRDEDELRREGNELNHCIGSYAQRHAEGKTAIFLIRRAETPDKPWYTLELDENKLSVRQNRGKHNCDKTKEIQAFEAAWIARCQELTVPKKKQRAKKRAVSQPMAGTA